MTKVINCVRCGLWVIGGIKITDREKMAVYTLRPINILPLEFEDVVCDECREGIGDKVADLFLTFNKKGDVK